MDLGEKILLMASNVGEKIVVPCESENGE